MPLPRAATGLRGARWRAPNRSAASCPTTGVPRRRRSPTEVCWHKTGAAPCRGSLVKLHSEQGIWSIDWTLDTEATGRIGLGRLLVRKGQARSQCQSRMQLQVHGHWSSHHMRWALRASDTAGSRERCQASGITSWVPQTPTKSRTWRFCPPSISDMFHVEKE